MKTLYVATCKNNNSDTDSIFLYDSKEQSSTILFSKSKWNKTWNINVELEPCNGSLADWKDCGCWTVKPIKKLKIAF